MNCNCGNWDDNTPCQIHGETKLPRPDVCWNTTYAIWIGRRSSNLKWFYTLAKDSIQFFQSGDFDTKKEVEAVLNQKLKEAV